MVLPMCATRVQIITTSYAKWHMAESLYKKKILLYLFFPTFFTTLDCIICPHKLAKHIWTGGGHMTYSVTSGCCHKYSFNSLFLWKIFPKSIATSVVCENTYDWDICDTSNNCQGELMYQNNHMHENYSCDQCDVAKWWWNITLRRLIHTTHVANANSSQWI